MKIRKETSEIQNLSLKLKEVTGNDHLIYASTLKGISERLYAHKSQEKEVMEREK